MSAEEFRLVVAIGLLWIIFNIKMAKADIVRAIKKLIHHIQKRKFCKANRWFCPDCIYHEHLFDGVVYRGVRCHYPKE